MRKYILLGVVMVFLLSVSALANGNECSSVNQLESGLHLPTTYAVQIGNEEKPGLYDRLYDIQIIALGAEGYAELEVNGYKTGQMSAGDSDVLSDQVTLRVKDVVLKEDGGKFNGIIFCLNGEAGEVIIKEPIKEPVGLEPAEKPVARLGLGEVDLSNIYKVLTIDNKLNAYLVVGWRSPVSDSLAMTDIGLGFMNQGFGFKTYGAGKLDSEINYP